MRHIHRIISILFVLAVTPQLSYPDTLFLKDGRRVKGLILNDYKDRVLISTLNGEEIFMKSDVKGALYDDEYRRLLQQGRNEVKRKDYVNAYYTYAEVLKKEPSNEEARERVDFLYKFLYTSPNREINDVLERRNVEEGNGDNTDPAVEVIKKTGYSLAQGEKYVVFEKMVDKDAGFAKKGIIRPGDEIVAVWGEMAAYMDVRDVAGIMCGPYDSSIVIQRKIKVKVAKDKGYVGPILAFPRKMLGAELEISERGMQVSLIDRSGPFDAAGICDGDIIQAVDGEDISYMPKKKVIEKIKRSKNADVEFTIRRKINLWGKRR